MTTRAGRVGDGDPAPGRALWFADMWFRGWGLGALVALVGTAVMLVLGVDAWRVPFVIAHLSGLLALAPLGVVLVVTTLGRYWREMHSIAGAVGGLLSHDRLVTYLVLASFVTAGVSLSQFEGGVRWVRAAANYSTVAIVLVLVWRYLRSARASR